MQLFGIIVVYNKHVRDSLTYPCLKAQKDLQVIVCDNSTTDYGNKETVEADGFHYINMGGNVGLSKAYNRAIQALRKVDFESDGYVCLFDDDTVVPDAYFEALVEQASLSHADVYLPVVLDEVGVLSPSILKKYYCHRATMPAKEIPKAWLCGINSGMAIRKLVFCAYTYDERVFLDYVDHGFIRDMRKQNASIEVLDVEIRQTFSSNMDSRESAERRFRIFRKDIRVFYSESLQAKAFYCYVIFRRKLQLCRKYRTVQFLLM